MICPQPRDGAQVGEVAVVEVAPGRDVLFYAEPAHSFSIHTYIHTYIYICERKKGK